MLENPSCPASAGLFPLDDGGAATRSCAPRARHSAAALRAWCAPSAKGYGSFVRRGLRASATSTHRPMPLPETKARRRSRQQHRRRVESGSNAAWCPCSSPDYRSLPLHRRACRVLHLEPIRRSVGASFKLNRLARDHHSPVACDSKRCGLQKSATLRRSTTISTTFTDMATGAKSRVPCPAWAPWLAER
jgi:hypothetical protein